MATRAPLALGTATGRSRPLNASRLLNLYAEPAPKVSISPWVLYGTPGQAPWSTVGSQDIRCGHEALGYTYILSGQTLYRVDSSKNAVACTGDSPAATGEAFITDNGTQVGMLVNGVMFYITGTTITQVTDGDFPTEGASSFDYIDGYGIFSRATTGQWFISSLHDFSAYDALDFATAESSPDNLVRVLANHKEVWLFGTKTIEVWQETGASPFPFEQIPGSLMDRGISAKMSALLMDNSVFWLGNDRILYRADGYTPIRISTFEFEESIREGVVDDAYAMTYAQGGHHFYVLTFPTLDITWVFDAATQIMHNRQSGTELVLSKWDVNCLFVSFDMILVGVAQGGVNELDLDTYTDNGSAIRAAVTSSALYPDGKRGTLDFVQLETELGVGLTAGQGVDPKWMAQFSKDGGMTYGNEKWASGGAIGNYRTRVYWRNMGMFRDGVLRIANSDPVKKVIYGANFEITGLS